MTEKLKITDFPLEERVKRFEQVVETNVNRVGPLGGLLLGQFGKTIVERASISNIDDRDTYTTGVVAPVIWKVIEETANDKKLLEAFSAVTWWSMQLFPPLR